MLSFASLTRFGRSFLPLLAVLTLAGSVPVTPVAAQETAPAGYSACLQTAWQGRGSGTTSAQFQERVTAIGGSAGDWSCQRVCLPAAQVNARCVSNGCTAPGQDATVKCCPSGTGQPPTAQNQCPASTGAGGSASATSSEGSVGRFTLPECTKTGNCGLNDIINTGTRFANFLFGIAGLVFFGTFIYAGVWMLFFAYDKGSYGKAKGMLQNAVIGMVIMIMAGTVVRFVFNALHSSSSASDAAPAITAPTKDTTKAS